jgi:hypothetical protein
MSMLGAGLALAILAGGGAAPAQADTLAEIDALSKATDKPASGIALARRQIEQDELLEAAASLERVLMRYPDNLEARLLHAGLLCRIDDRRGAILEFDLVRGLEVSDEVLAEARRPCQAGG